MRPVDNEIRGRVALVTGASGGIGAAIARDLYAHGVHLALTYAGNEAKARALAGELAAGGSESFAAGSSARPRISIHKLDLTCPEDMDALFAAFPTAHGRQGPDILVSNAGTAGFGNRMNPYLENISPEEFDHTLAINLRSAFLLCKSVVPCMSARGWGRIVLVSSISAAGGGVNGCHYAASKAGLSGLMRNLAYKHAADGITVNDVAPAMIGDTGMIPGEKHVEGTPGDVKNIPVGRLGTPQEVANVVTMICRTGYLTAQSILLSGGLK